MKTLFIGIVFLWRNAAKVTVRYIVRALKLEHSRSRFHCVCDCVGQCAKQMVLTKKVTQGK